MTNPKFFLLLLTLLLVAVSCNKNKPLYTYGSVKLAGQEVKVDVANNQASRDLGLAGREQIGEKQGMWFEFSTASKYSFWMKGMSFSLDIIWIKDGRIVYITYNAQPQSGVLDSDLLIFTPIAAVDRVLEVRAGWADRYGLKLGDEVDFSPSH